MFGDVQLVFKGIETLLMVGNDENGGSFIGGNRGMEIVEFAQVGHSGDGNGVLDLGFGSSWSFRGLGFWG